MHFLLMLVRLILDRLVPDWRDGLKLAARGDGRVEQVPSRPNRWSWWLNWLEELTSHEDRPPKTPPAAYGRARPRSTAAKSSASDPWPRN
jgi:hypothetical protein